MVMVRKQCFKCICVALMAFIRNHQSRLRRRFDEGILWKIQKQSSAGLPLPLPPRPASNAGLPLCTPCMLSASSIQNTVFGIIYHPDFLSLRRNTSKAAKNLV